MLTAEQAGDRAQLAQSLFQRGYLRGVRGEFANGLSDLKRLASLFEGLDKPAHLATVHNGLATLYNRMGDANQARAFYVLCSMSARCASRRPRFWSANSSSPGTTSGGVHENLGDWAAAERAFGRTLALARLLGYARGQAYARRGLAAVANAGGRATQALERLEEAAARQRTLSDERLRGQILLQRGVALTTLGQQRAQRGRRWRRRWLSSSAPIRRPRSARRNGPGHGRTPPKATGRPPTAPTRTSTEWPTGCCGARSTSGWRCSSWRPTPLRARPR